MEPISNLDGLRCALSSAFGVRTSAIANDYLDARVCAQPIGEDLGGTVIEQVNGPVGLQIEQQRAVAALLLSQRDIIDTQNSRTTLFTSVGKRMEQAEQRIGTDGYAGFARQASAALATSLERERRQQLGRVVRTPGVMCQHAIEALGEDLTWAI